MKKPKETETLFGDLDQFDGWRKEWQDMPEFNMEDLKPIQTVYVHFETIQDRDDFAELIGQNIYTTTKSIWHPKLEITRFMNKRYIDEEE